MLNGYLNSYHDEHTNVSNVSTSLLASFPHFGHLQFTNASDFASGDFPSGLNSTSFGRSTGKSFSSTKTSPAIITIYYWNWCSPISLS